MTKEEFIREANIKHNFVYDYSLVDYKNKTTKIKIICKQHGVFEDTPFNHINLGYKCNICGKEERRKKTIERNISNIKTKEYFVNKSNEKYSFVYEYNKVIYYGVNNKVIITCRKHGDFEQTPSHHLSNSGGCLKCKNDKRLSNFIIKAKEKHGDNFDYRETVYEQPKISIKCITHGYFKQTMQHHLKSPTGGCMECGNLSRKKSLPDTTISNSEFINICSKLHNYFYDYSLVHYKGRDSFIHIICPKHGIFTQKASDHRSGCGCKHCATSNKSKMEQKWLNHHNIPQINRNIKIKINDKTFVVDGFDEKTNTVYEFWGDYWHGNPKKYKPDDINKSNKKTFGVLYEETLKKIDIIQKAGYNLIDIWEYDWIRK